MATATTERESVVPAGRPRRVDGVPVRPGAGAPAVPPPRATAPTQVEFLADVAELGREVLPFAESEEVQVLIAAHPPEGVAGQFLLLST